VGRELARGPIGPRALSRAVDRVMFSLTGLARRSPTGLRKHRHSPITLPDGARKWAAVGWTFIATLTGPSVSGNETVSTQ